MRRFCLCLSTALAFAATSAAAQQPPGRELRLAVSQHDVLHLEEGDRESGVNLEVQAFSGALDGFWGSPRAFIVASGNSDGDTAFASVGLAWTRQLSERWSGELQVGYAIHDGKSDTADPTRLRLGSTDLFRTVLGADFAITDRWAIGVQWEHLSHGEILANNDMPNQGLDTAGVRFSRRF